MILRYSLYFIFYRHLFVLNVITSKKKKKSVKEIKVPIFSHFNLIKEDSFVKKMECKL